MDYQEQMHFDAIGAQAEAELENNQDAAYAEHLANEVELSPTSIVALFETNKEQRSSFALGVLEALEDGRIEPLKLHKQIKAMEDVIALLTDKKKYPTTATAYSKYVLDAAEKQDSKAFDLYGAKWQIKEVGSTWDYSQCGDSELVRLQDEAKAAADALKERQTYLQNLPACGVEALDKETGEMATIYKPSKSSTTSVSVTLK